MQSVRFYRIEQGKKKSCRTKCGRPLRRHWIYRVCRAARHHGFRTVQRGQPVCRTQSTRWQAGDVSRRRQPAKVRATGQNLETGRVAKRPVLLFRAGSNQWIHYQHQQRRCAPEILRFMRRRPVRQHPGDLPEPGRCSAGRGTHHWSSYRQRDFRYRQKWRGVRRQFEWRGWKYWSRKCEWRPERRPDSRRR